MNLRIGNYKPEQLHGLFSLPGDVNVNARDAWDMTALKWAAVWKDADAIKPSLQFSADPEIAEHGWKREFHFAAIEPVSSEALLSGGAEVDGERGYVKNACSGRKFVYARCPKPSPSSIPIQHDKAYPAEAKPTPLLNIALPYQVDLSTFASSFISLSLSLSSREEEKEGKPEIIDEGIHKYIPTC